jgi:hypothetical protein
MDDRIKEKSGDYSWIWEIRAEDLPQKSEELWPSGCHKDGHAHAGRKKPARRKTSQRAAA